MLSYGAAAEKLEHDRSRPKWIEDAAEKRIAYINFLNKEAEEALVAPESETITTKDSKTAE